MDKALTIIIPAYNVADYIEQGLDSLIEDKEILALLDIIIVNDGSKDNTLSLVSKYCELYPDCIRVIDKENGGHGSGINVGIKLAWGKYLKVLDGDDWVNPTGMRELVSFINEGLFDPDLIVNPFEKVWENGKKEKISFDTIECGEIVGFSEVVRNNYTIPLHSFTIKTKIYREHDIPQIDEKISYDDMEYILYPVPYIKTITFLRSTVYEYRLGLPGQSMNPAQMLKKLPMHTKVIESLAKYYYDHKQFFSADGRAYYEKEFVDTLGTNCELRLRSGSNKSQLRSFINEYRSFPLEKMKNRKIRFLIKNHFLGYKLVLLYANNK